MDALELSRLERGEDKDAGVFSQLRIVIAEDDQFMAEIVATLARDLGVGEVVVAPDGASALAALAGAPECTQIVFCDLRMPGMDGLELIRHLAARKECQAVVLLSGEDHRILASATELARNSGLRVLGSLTKPVSREGIKHTLASFTGVRPTFVKAGERRQDFEPTVDDLRAAIANDELVVYYQPRVLIATRQACGLEGLVRWQHPRAGLVPPMSFVPLAEREGLIDALTARVFERALLDLAEWQHSGVELSVSLNATVDSLARFQFADELSELAERCHAPLHKITIEVTESRLAGEFDRVLETLTRLRLRRVGVAIDDFGTGYSTLDQLRRLPFTELKVDRTFVHGCHADATRRAILESSVGLGRRLGMTTVAEGVETEEDFRTVSLAGCDEVQGYFFARPMPKQAVLTWLSNRGDQSRE